MAAIYTGEGAWPIFDLVVRGGLVVDGSGGEPFEADVAVKNGRIAAVGQVSGHGQEEIDAKGKIVTPGFVDVHTHYDGQATWDEQLAPSCWHGVTTVVLGNCGVGFAPVRPGSEEALIQLMEGVEDIPGTVLAEGLAWGWESFPEYLRECCSRRRWMIDVGTHVPHAAVRAYVMGGRANDDRVTEDDLSQMSAIVRAGIEAGALGVSTSRILAHRTSTGAMVPGTLAKPADELAALANVLRDLETGVFRGCTAPRGMDGEATAEAHAEIDLDGRDRCQDGPPRRVLRRPDPYRTGPAGGVAVAFRLCATGGVPIYPQVANRPLGILFGLESPDRTFSTRPTYRAHRRPTAKGTKSPGCASSDIRDAENPRRTERRSLRSPVKQLRPYRLRQHAAGGRAD